VNTYVERNNEPFSISNYIQSMTMLALAKYHSVANTLNPLYFYSEKKLVSAVPLGLKCGTHIFHELEKVSLFNYASFINLETQGSVCRIEMINPR